MTSGLSNWTWNEVTLVLAVALLFLNARGAIRAMFKEGSAGWNFLDGLDSIIIGAIKLTWKASWCLAGLAGFIWLVKNIWRVV